ncbi:hypothetical protein [Aquipuribacter sp. SD81]|uniref:hypothetical protein n=1 Tax=Aquipuribacter sp. SD81 TaxID=3127703 RepID=UPI0030188631
MRQGAAATGAAAAERRGTSSPAVGLTLPEDWVAVPLEPRSSRRRAVRDLARRAEGGGDAAALLRVRLRARLEALADDAAAHGAQQLVLSLARTPEGAALPASLVVVLVASSLPQHAAGAVPVGAELSPPGRSGWWRARRVHEPARPGPAADERHGTLAVDYWVGHRDDGHVAVLSFSSPLPGLRDVLLPLFDAVAASARWPRG